MTRISKHILIPSLAPVLLVGLYFMPVSLIGCVNRGLIALAVVFVSLLGGIAVAVRGLRLRRRDSAQSGWWIVSACILALPAVLVLGPLG